MKCDGHTKQPHQCGLQKHKTTEKASFKSDRHQSNIYPHPQEWERSYIYDYIYKIQRIIIMQQLFWVFKYNSCIHCDSEWSHNMCHVVTLQHSQHWLVVALAFIFMLSSWSYLVSFLLDLHFLVSWKIQKERSNVVCGNLGVEFYRAPFHTLVPSTREGLCPYEPCLLRC